MFSFALKEDYTFFLLLYTSFFVSLWDLKSSGQTSLSDWFLIVDGSDMSLI